MKHDFTDRDTLDNLEAAIDELLNDGRDDADGKVGFVLLIGLPSGSGKYLVHGLSNVLGESAVFMLRSAVEEYDRQNGEAND